MKWIKGAPDKMGIYFCYVRWDEESELKEVVTIAQIPRKVYWVGSKELKEITPEMIIEWLDETETQPS